MENGTVIIQFDYPSYYLTWNIIFHFF